MNRRWFQFVLMAILTIATFTPLLEIFDRWDVLSGPWNDTELGVTALFIGVAISLAIAFLLRLSLVCSLQNVFLGLFQSTDQGARHAQAIEAKPRISLPPLIPLRI